MNFVSKRRLITIALWLLTGVGVWAQRDYREGYIITNQQDTIYGWIDYRGDIRNAKICSFKETETGQTTDSVIKIWKQIGSVRHIFNDFILNFPEWESTIYKNKAYISANGKIWEFNSEKYFFEEKYLGETGGSYLYTHNDMIYIVGRNNFIEYDPATNLIKQLPQHKHTLNTGPYIFFWKNFLYNYVYLNDDYKWEYIVFDLDLIEK